MMTIRLETVAFLIIRTGSEGSKGSMGSEGLSSIGSLGSWVLRVLAHGTDGLT